MKNIALTNTLGLVRSLLALSLLSTLIFNPSSVFFIESTFEGMQKTGFILDRLNFFFLAGYENAFLMQWLAIIILSAVVAGWRPRITGVLHWWVAYSFMTASIIVEGGDQVVSVLSFLLIPVTLLDKRRNHWSAEAQTLSKSESAVAGVFYFLTKLQVAIVYLEAGIGKLYSTQEWREGTALYYWINDNFFGRNDAVVFVSNYLLTDPVFASLLTYGVIGFEIMLFGMLFSNAVRFRRTMFLLGLGFHFMIVIYFGLISFFMSMAGALCLYLLEPGKRLDQNFDFLLRRFEKNYAGAEKESVIIP